MNMLIRCLIAIACFSGTGQQQANKSDILSASAEATHITAGKKKMAVITVRVKEGYHIQANRVADASLIPVTLKIIQPAPFNTSEAIFPPYKLFQLEGTTHYLYVFDSTFIIRLPFKIPASAKPGRYLIRARLQYQACHAKNCLFPRAIDLELPVVVL